MDVEIKEQHMIPFELPAYLFHRLMDELQWGISICRSRLDAMHDPKMSGELYIALAAQVGLGQQLSWGREKMHLREPDRDLRNALECHPQDFSLADIEGVAATIPGANDELAWYWVAKIGNRWALLVGWCAYTGWDCQSGLDVSWASSAMETAALAPNQEEHSHRSAICGQLLAQLVGKQPYGLYIGEGE